MGRAFDLTLASLLVLFTLPLLAVFALAVGLQGGGRILTEHQRVGGGGQLFGCLKFRTVGRDRQVTRIGDFLRRSNLEDLPQLFNVLRGDMSIIGPRPIKVAEVSRYGHRFGLYCAVRPGLTGLWQLAGRYDASYRRRVAADTVYAGKKSLLFDLRLLALAVPALFS